MELTLLSHYEKTKKSIDKYYAILYILIMDNSKGVRQMATDLTIKDRVLLLSALVHYQLELKDKIAYWEKFNDAEMVENYKAKLEQATELHNSSRLI